MRGDAIESLDALAAKGCFRLSTACKLTLGNATKRAAFGNTLHDVQRRGQAYLLEERCPLQST